MTMTKAPASVEKDGRLMKITTKRWKIEFKRGWYYLDILIGDNWVSYGRYFDRCNAMETVKLMRVG